MTDLPITLKQLEKLEADLRAAIKDRDAEDISALRQEISELREELKARGATPPPPRKSQDDDDDDDDDDEDPWG